MRKLLSILLSTTTVAVIASAASAADLPSRISAPPAFAPPIFTWSGFYVGVNAGGAFSVRGQRNTFRFVQNSIVNSEATSGLLTVSNGRNRESSFEAGGQVGYNFQLSPGSSWVFGVEADIQAMRLGKSGRRITNNYTFVPDGANLGNLGLAFLPPAAAVSVRESRQSYFGTVRARIGYAFDRFLVYGTGGLAYGSGGNGGGGGGNGRFGYAIGPGVEYAFTDHWTAKLEGLYVRLGKQRGENVTAFYNPNFAPQGLVSIRGANRQNEFVVVRAGVNYKF